MLQYHEGLIDPKGEQGNVPYFLEISPHLEILPPSKCCCIFQPTYPNKRHPRNLTTWYWVETIYLCARTLYMHTNKLITELCTRVRVDLCRRCPRNPAALELSPHSTVP